MYCIVMHYNELHYTILSCPACLLFSFVLMSCCGVLSGPVPGVKIPSGGNGGGGGSVFIVADSSLTSLSLQVSHFNAENGGNGGGAL
jgi:hypothetical protein